MVKTFLSRPQSESLVGWQFLAVGLILHLVVLLFVGDVSFIELPTFIPYEAILLGVALGFSMWFKTTVMKSMVVVHWILLILLALFYILK